MTTFKVCCQFWTQYADWLHNSRLLSVEIDFDDQETSPSLILDKTYDSKDPLTNQSKVKVQDLHGASTL